MITSCSIRWVGPAWMKQAEYSRPRKGGSPRRRPLKGGSVQKVEIWTSWNLKKSVNFGNSSFRRLESYNFDISKSWKWSFELLTFGMMIFDILMFTKSILRALKSNFWKKWKLKLSCSLWLLQTNGWYAVLRIEETKLVWVISRKSIFGWNIKN